MIQILFVTIFEDTIPDADRFLNLYVTFQNNGLKFLI